MSLCTQALSAHNRHPISGASCVLVPDSGASAPCVAACALGDLWRELVQKGNVIWVFSLQERHHARSARVSRNIAFDNPAPLAEHPAYILSLCRPEPRNQIPTPCGFFRSHLLICAAKPRYTAAAAREHWHALAPRLPPPAQVSLPREVLYEMCQRRVLLPRLIRGCGPPWKTRK